MCLPTSAAPGVYISAVSPSIRTGTSAVVVAVNQKYWNSAAAMPLPSAISLVSTVIVTSSRAPPRMRTSPVATIFGTVDVAPRMSNSNTFVLLIQGGSPAT